MATGPGPAVGLCRAGDGPAVNAVKEFLVLDLGEGLEDATITGWNVAVGDGRTEPDAVHGGDQQGRGRDSQPHAGRIVDLGGAEGDTLTVGSVLVRIATQGSAEVVAPSLSANGTARKPVLVGYGPTTPWTVGEDRSVTARGQAAGAKAGLELNVDLSQVMVPAPTA